MTDNRPAAAAEAARAEAERAEIMSVALAQPHRRGNDSPLAGSALGRFVLVHFDRAEHAEIYDCGESYARLVWSLNQALGIRMPVHLAWDFPSDAEIDGRKLADKLDDWRELLAKYNRALLKGGRAGFQLCHDMILFETPVLGLAHTFAVRICLRGLHKEIYG